jgi:PilZ domain
MPDKSEPRFQVDLLIRVFGLGADDRPFSQQAHTRNISDRGARLSGLERPLRLGSVIGVQFGDRKARCRVAWTVNSGLAQKIEAGVEIMGGQPCPWQKEIGTQRATATAAVIRTKPVAKDKRKFPRRRLSIEIEIRDGQSVGTHLNMQTADIAGGGCYIETLRPLPLRRTLSLTFWLNSERVQTTAIVRTSDGGVGMGIEFTGLDEATQRQLQQQVERLAAGPAPFRKAKSAV